MNDFIDLPHLPEGLLGLPLETLHEIQSHTYHAIKVDRKQRGGEPVGELEPTFPAGNSNMLGGVYKLGFFSGQGIPVYTGPQPAEQHGDPESNLLTKFFAALDQATALDSKQSQWSNKTVGSHHERVIAWAEVHRLRGLLAPQPADKNIDYRELFEQMCERCDALDEELAQHSEPKNEPVAWRVGTDLFHTEEEALANVRNPDLRPIPLCDCERSHNGMGMAGRECDCGAPQPTPALSMNKEFSQFLADAMTAAGLVSHGKQCKALGERLSKGCMNLRNNLAAPKFGEEE